MIVAGSWAALLLIGLAALWFRLESGLAKTRDEVTALNGAMAQNQRLSSIYLKILIRKPGITPELAYEIAEVIHEESIVFKKSPNLLIAMAEHESHFNPKAVSNVGAQGLLQVMPQWKEILGVPAEDLSDIRINVRRGLQVLGSYQNHYRDLHKALTAYNRGAGPVDTALMRGQDPGNGYADRIMETYERLNEIDRAQIRQ